MVWHCWGDKWFAEHGNELGVAMHEMLDKLREVNIRPIIKEKYGTVRWEMCFAWYPTDLKTQNMFYEIIENVCKEHPNVAAEIVDDLAMEFNHPKAEELYEKYGDDSCDLSDIP